MIKKLVTRMSTAGKKAGESFKAAIRAGTHPCTSAVSYMVRVTEIIVPSDALNALNAGKRYRIHEVHAPIFSLFTFFGLRPQ
jgi:hypothetical protein